MRVKNYGYKRTNIYSIDFVSKCYSKGFGPKWPVYQTIAITFFFIDVQRNSIERKNVI